MTQRKGNDHEFLSKWRESNNSNKAQKKKKGKRKNGGE
jgi:hypothetical protein